MAGGTDQPFCNFRIYLRDETIKKILKIMERLVQMAYTSCMGNYQV